MKRSPPPSLPKRADFLRAAAQGRKRAHPGFLAQIVTSDDATNTLRVGLTASRKVGNAVVRNRARRRLREAVRTLMADRLASGTAPTGVDLVLIARRNTAFVKFESLQAGISAALDEAAALVTAYE